MTSPNGNIFPVNGHRWLPSQRPVSFYGFFDLYLNKRLSKQKDASDLRRHRAHYDVTVMRNPSQNEIWQNLAPLYPFQILHRARHNACRALNKMSDRKYGLTRFSQICQMDCLYCWMPWLMKHRAMSSATSSSWLSMPGSRQRDFPAHCAADLGRRKESIQPANMG